MTIKYKFTHVCQHPLVCWVFLVQQHFFIPVLLLSCLLNTERQSERTVMHAADPFIRLNNTVPEMVDLQTTTHQKLKWILQNGDFSVWPVVESKNWPVTKIGTKHDKYKWKRKRFGGNKIIGIIGKIMGLKRMGRSGDKMYVTGMSVSFIVNWFVCLRLQVNY